ncbi:MAG: hypothetical protein IJR87_12455, partial [Bacteroidaceae bacterium]|nr:hypothetical protein [Bacteroidaceae bacterium]
MKRILLSLLALVAIGTGARAQDMTATPLTLEATTGGDITFNLTLGYGTDPSVMNAIEYQKNDGAWTTYTWGDAIPVVANDKVAFRGNNAKYYGNGSPSFNSYITSTADVYVYGNIMSLISSDGFASLTTLTGDWNFAYLFAQPRASWGDPVIDVTTIKSHPTKDIVLPATTLTNYCYFGMFEGCKDITRAPALPATTMKNGCYAEMFRSSGLVTAPELPCTVFDPYYFDESGEHGSIDCYMQMFQDCTNLTTAPAILPATRLTHGVYQYMFQGCTSLTTAPVLPATKLAAQAYCNMFEGCTSLNYVKCFATDISENWAVDDWLKGVAATGTFVKSAAMTSWPSGDSGIPAGWTVENTTAADGDMSITPLTLQAVEAGTITIKNTNGLTLDYTSSVSGAHSSTDNPVTITVAADETIALQCSNTTKGMNFGISSSNDIYVYGNPMSLVFGSGFAGQADMSGCEYGILAGLFHPAMDGATLYPHTKNHPTKDIVLPATTISNGCYMWMFSGCKGLTSAPDLPATTLAEDCYHRMFQNTGLTTAPDLPAAHVVGQCYGGMFDGCTSLNYVRCLATSFDNKQDLGDWLQNVSATGVFIKGGVVDYPRGASGIPTGWTVDREWGVGDTETLTANDDGEGNYWTTYYNGLTSVTADANTTVYKAKVSGDKVVLTDVGSKDIPAGNAVVMKSSASSVTLSVGYSSGTLSGNELLGQSVPFTTPDNLYALVGDATNPVGFYNYPTQRTFGSTTIPTTFPDQKAYLIIAGGGGVKAFYPLTGEGGTTAIELAEDATEAQ